MPILNKRPAAELLPLQSKTDGRHRARSRLMPAAALGVRSSTVPPKDYGGSAQSARADLDTILANLHVAYPG
jgi:hypothetical protein